MTGGKQIVIVTACAFLVGAGLATLRWTANRVEDISFTPPLPDEAGEPLDPESVAWLGDAPERSQVDPAAVEASLDRLRTHLGEVFTYETLEPPAAVMTDVEIPAGWNDSDHVSVLTGARQTGTIRAPADRCAFLTETAAWLAGGGWELGFERRDAIQTEYPLVSPGPQNLTLSGLSPLGRLTVGAPDSGDYVITFDVDESTLAHAETGDGAGQSEPADPIAIRCP